MIYLNDCLGISLGCDSGKKNQDVQQKHSFTFLFEASLLTVALRAVDEEQLSITTCAHVFHTECLKEVVKHFGTCPAARASPPGGAERVDKQFASYENNR